jgi:elongation factor 2
LLVKAGLVQKKKSGKAQIMDGREDEKSKGITIKSTGISLYYEVPSTADNKKEGFLINLIDSPGHVDFSSEVTAALRVTDGALVVVDCVEGVCVQTGTVLRQAMGELIKPVLMINKIDRAIFELKEDGESIYQMFVRCIDNVNAIVANYDIPEMGDNCVDPTKGQVCFGSGKDQWGFSLITFARLYAKRFNIKDINAFAKKLWGDHYWDPEAKKITTDNQSASGKTLERTFVKFIMNPIIKLANACLDDNKEEIAKMSQSLGIVLDKEDVALKGKDLMKATLSTWIGAADSIIEMLVTQLPSPKKAQEYRVKYLYEGPQDDPCAEAIRNCDPDGPVMVYISKMIPAAERGKFYAFGRVFSGTVRQGQTVRIMGPNYIPGRKDDLAIKAIQRTVLMMASKIEAVPEVPCGNTVALAGIDQYLLKTGTISDHEAAHNIRTMKYSVSPVVRIAVEPKNPSEVGKLVDGLAKLANSDSIVEVVREETGQHVIGCAGELHAEICLTDLEKYAGIKIVKAKPIVTYKETISAETTQVCLSKSANKHNRLFVDAQPVDEDLSAALEKGELDCHGDIKKRNKKLVDEFGWDKEDALKLWIVGPEESTGTNMLVNSSKGVDMLNEIQDPIKNAFTRFTNQGALCNEALRSMRVNIRDAKVHGDPVHRGGGQVMEMSRRVFHAAQLDAKPRLMEPVFEASITAPYDVMGGVYQCLNSRRGLIVEEEPLAGTPMNVVKAHLPVSESFGFTEYLRS